MKFLKNFGLGLLYALLFPVILAAVAVFAVYGFLRSIVYFFISLVRFFKGEKIFAAFPEDEKAKEIIDRARGLKKEEAPAQQQAPQQNIYVQQNYYPNQGLPPQGQQPQQPGLPNPGYPQQGLPNQGYPQQGIPNQGYPNQPSYGQPLPPYGQPQYYGGQPFQRDQLPPGYGEPTPVIPQQPGQAAPQPEAITLNREVPPVEPAIENKEMEGDEDDD